jgi:hypothetical protein
LCDAAGSTFSAICKRDQSTWLLRTGVKGIALEDAAEAEPPLVMVVVAGSSADIDGSDCGAGDDGEAAIPGLGDEGVRGVEVLVDFAALHEADDVETFSEEWVELEELALVAGLEEIVLIAEELVFAVGAETEGAAEREALEVGDVGRCAEAGAAGGDDEDRVLGVEGEVGSDSAFGEGEGVVTF